MEHSVTHRVDVIVDLRDVKRLPPNVISKVVTIARQQPDNLYLSVFVSESRFIRALMRVTKGLSAQVRQSYRLANSIEQALLLIQQERTRTPQFPIK